MIAFGFIIFASFPKLASSRFLSSERILFLILWSNVCRTSKQPKPTPDISHPALRFSVPGCSCVWVVVADQLPLTQFPSIMPRAPIPAQLSHHPRLYHSPIAAPFSPVLGLPLYCPRLLDSQNPRVLISPYLFVPPICCPASKSNLMENLICRRM